MHGFFVLFTSFVGLGFVSDNPLTAEVDGLPILGKVGVDKLISFLTSILGRILSSVVVLSSLIGTLGVEIFET